MKKQCDKLGEYLMEFLRQLALTGYILWPSLKSPWSAGSTFSWRNITNVPIIIKY